jgi:hypothetical protein
MLFADMLTGVLSKAKGCPEIEALVQMRNACMEFCERTRWLTTGYTATVTPADAAVPVGLDLQVLDIIEAWIGDKEVTVTHMNDPWLRCMRQSDVALIFSDPSYAQLVPSPTVDTEVELLLAIAPGPTATEVNDVLWLRKSEALTDGALARVLASPGVSWSNPAVAEYHGGRFERAIVSSAAEAGLNRRTRGRRLRVRPADLL